MPNKLRMSQQVSDERWSRICTKNIKIRQIEGRSKTIEKKWVNTKTNVKICIPSIWRSFFWKKIESFQSKRASIIWPKISNETNYQNNLDNIGLYGQ